MTKAKWVKFGFSTTASGKQIVGQASLRYGKTDFAAAVNMTMPGLGKTRVVVLPNEMFMRLPPGTGLPAGRPWVEVRTDGGANDPLSKALAPVMRQMEQSFDPNTSMRTMTVIPTLSALGTEQVGGVETRKYTATVDLAHAAAQAKGPLAKKFRALVAGGITTMDYTIWIDGQNLPRQVRTVTATSNGEVTASYTYRDWGKPVTIKAPPARQTTTSAMLVGT